jgi:hypothetical protein
VTDLFCPTHPQTKLVFALKGGAGYCSQCSFYVQARGVPMPKTTKETGKSVKAKKKGRAKTR